MRKKGEERVWWNRGIKREQKIAPSGSSSLEKTIFSMQGNEICSDDNKLLDLDVNSRRRSEK